VLRREWTTILFIVVVLGLRAASAPTATAAMLLLALYALAGRRQAVLALVLVWLFMMLNTNFVPRLSGVSMLRYVVILMAALSVLLRGPLLSGSGRFSRFGIWTLGLGVLIMAHSIALSEVPTVSFLKAASWTTAILTATGAWSGMSTKMQERTSNTIYVLLALILVFSLLTLPLPGAHVSGWLFKGILVNSQVLGATIALLSVWTFARVLQNPTYVGISLFVATFPVLLFSGARTSLFAVFLAMLFTPIIFPILTGRRLSMISRVFRSRRLVISAGVLLLPMVFMAPVLVQNFGDFLRKNTDSLGVLEAYDNSRGRLISEMWENIQENPLTGIGFGIASDPVSMRVDTVGGIPISALVEKGVMPLAVLEELGIFGAGLTAVWLLMILFRSSRSNFSSLMVVLTILAINLGESMLFSPGGMGLLFVIFVGWAVAQPTIGYGFQRRSLQ